MVSCGLFRQQALRSIRSCGPSLSWTRAPGTALASVVSKPTVKSALRCKPAALASDLGHGKFDGAGLVQNFENQNPANTLWTKQYSLYSKIDTEAPRYLGFEKWWGGHVNLNAEEIQFIVDELFIGNNLAAGRIQKSDGTAIDLRNIRSPISVFCAMDYIITPTHKYIL